MTAHSMPRADSEKATGESGGLRARVLAGTCQNAPVTRAESKQRGVSPGLAVCCVPRGQVARLDLRDRRLSLNMQMCQHVAALDFGARAFQHGAALVHDQIAVGNALGEGEILLDDNERGTS
jgi:hypothetical protein